MKTRLIPILVLVLFLVACDGDEPELSSDSTILTGGTNAPATSTTAAEPGDAGSPSTTLVGEVVGSFDIVARFPNENGEERWYVIPNGAYTDVDLYNFVIELLEADEELYGAEVFDSAAAAAAYEVDAADRTEEETELIERHHFVTLVGRDRIEYQGPFSESPDGAIGS